MAIGAKVRSGPVPARVRNAAAAVAAVVAWGATRGACIAGIASSVGCALFVPTTRGAAEHARSLAPKCHGLLGGTDASRAGTEDLSAPAQDAVDSVEPAYAYVHGGPNGREARLRGARIHLRPLPGVSRESAARSIECHEARVVLGLSAPLAVDPYVSPDQWLSIDVESEGDALVVLVTTDDLDTARRVLATAHLFANAHRGEAGVLAAP